MRGVNTMQMKLYNVPESREHLTKTLGTATTFTGAVRGEIDMVSPIVTVAATITTHFNYAYLDDYAAYYWVREITVERKGLSIVQLERDPLMTFAADIRKCSCIAARTASAGKNTWYIPDPMIKQNQYTYDETIAGGSIFGYNGSFILITTG